MTETDLLAPPRDRHVINGAALAAALHRKRATILALAIIGAFAGALVSIASPAPKSASTVVYLRFPDGTDATQAMPTELTVLTTRAVARSALHALGSNQDPATLLSKYHGTIASNSLLRLSATGRDATTAQRRADAVANAFLAYRAQLAQEELGATVSALNAQRKFLVQQNPTSAQIQQIDATIQNAQVSAETVAKGSHVIDTASVTAVSTKKAIAKNAGTGLLVGLVLGVGSVLFMAVVTTRLRRRADIAAALHAPVVLSLGPVVPSGWRRFVEPAPTTEHPNADLERVVGHLDRTLTLTANRALVVVSIDSLDASRLAVLTLAERLRERNLAVTLVNETDAELPDSEHDARGENGGDIVLVLAVLKPADGAEHLREWGSNAVAIVTAGRSTESKLAANATMLRSAALDLGSVVLLGSDASDATLGIVLRDGSLPAGPVDAEERSRATVESS